ncbi:hypothetical protein [Paraburkholderia sp. UCT31]|uniref:hypothetical protein n=1 Tax=Paraburkholderia sp. UCT31 TaxID=2615209 RepID=UPI001CA39E98|nr:hypothetical protein [Paraburkholderia sp. UCT31]
MAFFLHPYERRFDETASERAEVERLYGLDAPLLANRLLQLARSARRSEPEWAPEDRAYESRLIFGVVPELARRLGGMTMRLHAFDRPTRTLSDSALRMRAGDCLSNIRHRRAEGWVLLTRDIEDGNPVGIAADRLVAGRVGDSDDAFIRRLDGVARVRGIEYEGVWTPENFRR